MNGGTMYEQGDVVLMPFPYSDLSTAKQRPALILSNSKFNKTQDRICCLITSQACDGIKITKNYYQQGKLPFSSWVKPYRIFTVHEKVIRKKLCRLNANFHQAVLQSLQEYVK